MNPLEAIAFDKRQHGDTRVVAIFRQSPEMQRLAVVWPDVPKNTEALFDPKAAGPEKDAEQWEWLWGLVTYNEERWIRMALLPFNSYSKSLIQRMIDLHMVYPDGTLQGWVQRYVMLVSLAPFRGLEKEGKEDKKPEEVQPDPKNKVRVTKVGG